MARVAQHWVFLAAFLPAQRPWTTLQRHTFCLTSDAGRLPARTGTVPCPTLCFGIDFDLSQILTPWQFGTLWSVPNYFSWILLAWKVSLVPLKLQPILGGSAAPRTLSTEAHYQKAGAFVVHHIFFILLRNVPAHLSFILSIFLGSTHTHTPLSRLSVYGGESKRSITLDHSCFFIYFTCNLFVHKWKKFLKNNASTFSCRVYMN